MNELKARLLLSKCRGDEIWSIELCQQEGVPEPWIVELRDAHESGFDHDRNTIYEKGRMVNQYEGVSDLLLAFKLAEFLGIDWEEATKHSFSRVAQVTAIQEFAEDGE